VERFNEWLGTLPHAHKLVVAGNHDIAFDTDHYESLWRRFHKMKVGWAWHGMAWHTSPGGWAGLGWSVVQVMCRVPYINRVWFTLAAGLRADQGEPRQLHIPRGLGHRALRLPLLRVSMATKVP
jgi:hypothetical protein